MVTLSTQQLQVGYGDKVIIQDLSLHIPEGEITCIIGPNGCGKSTLLKTLARIQRAKSGSIFLDGKAIQDIPTKEIAKQMAILPQTPGAPNGLTVYELVSFGRSPYKKGYGKLTNKDRDVIEWALEVTGTDEFRDQAIDALSGGQRQRAWIAMAIAQETELLMLDEPTTYLDLAHQLEVLKLLERLNKEEQRTIVMVIHDLNHAARFSNYMVAMNSGAIIKEGTPFDVMTPENLRHVFNIEADIIQDPKSGKPVCLSYDLIEQKTLVKK
ncbi:iron(3+)-hydroxamate import ATP-binding protein FhuC [Pullulanibacillus camelliae]|uniref:Iron(3+)-hydroxamate import ATP-binding protein FhuC n=1 Tax=Pullulanibacillus camelliae TaxID=1707096 RepID=A0A8J3DY96_9BACL|nr:ABC transporter ATP-binding protein [Pullulanibacillus camelliae]GGE53038.1 iron(3+)-hydroxamate import ATP-binding protein FhuC [Pullulanibacillus camelliae]